jgi:hypothetical protein
MDERDQRIEALESDAETLEARVCSLEARVTQLLAALPSIPKIGPNGGKLVTVADAEAQGLIPRQPTKSQANRIAAQRGEKGE